MQLRHSRPRERLFCSIDGFSPLRSLCRWFAGGLALYWLIGSGSGSRWCADGLEQPIQEFFIAETVYPQERDEVQVTLTPSFWKSGHLRNGELLLEAKYGITNRFQVGAAFPYRALRNEEGDRHHGVGDVQLSVLYNLLPGNDPFALSTSLEVEFPTGDENADLGEGEVG